MESQSVRFILMSILSGIAMTLTGQASGYNFNETIDLGASPVKNQYRSGTCWSYAAVSFLESELLRTGKGEFDLSEMFLVRQCYHEKADNFVRMHGKSNFGNGGLAMDLLLVWKKYGLVPESEYPGNLADPKGPVHGEMDAVLKGYIDEVIKNPNQKLSSSWKEGFDGILDAYLGQSPERFNYNGKKYTAESFADGLGLDPDDYVCIGSFSHQPYYEPFVLEIPDNWDWNRIDNVTLDELVALLDYALDKGYTLCWDADVGERGFNWEKGLALIPSQRFEDLSNLEEGRWSEMSERERMAMIYDFSVPKKEMEITQEIRQQWFDDYSTTDDHLMHITGKAVDQDGNTFYKVKNSWGSEGHLFEGYMYCSESYIRAKTLFFMLHRDAVPAEISAKLGYK